MGLNPDGTYLFLCDILVERNTVLIQALKHDMKCSEYLLYPAERKLSHEVLGFLCYHRFDGIQCVGQR